MEACGDRVQLVAPAANQPLPAQLREHACRLSLMRSWPCCLYWRSHMLHPSMILKSGFRFTFMRYKCNSERGQVHSLLRSCLGSQLPHCWCTVGQAGTD